MTSHYRYNKTGTLGFEGTAFDWATMIMHTVLAYSSILFRVPKFRLDDKPMVIYEEYRQHAMVFTTRCFFVFVFAVSWYVKKDLDKNRMLCCHVVYFNNLALTKQR